MKLIAAAAMALCMSLTPPAFAQSNPVVVELFTSQGCSSCPPADKLLQELARRNDVIPLALHVDYWDYIGWKDLFARPQHAERQRAYAQVAGRHMIYTPQMIVNGQDDVVGARAMELADLIDAHRSTAAVIRLQASRNGERISIRAQALQPVQEPLTIFLIRFTPQHRTEIKRGENAGQVLNYANVVDDWRILGQWDGKAVFETSTTVEGPRPAVVLVQKPGPGAIVAAELVK